MKSYIFKEHKKRNSYKKIEKKIFIKNGFHFIEKNNSFNIIQNHSLKKFKETQKGIKMKVHNRCIFTGRTRSVFKKFKISRHFFRNKASYGLITGLSKVS